EEAAWSRHQRPDIPSPGPLDVDDRRVSVARLRFFGPARDAAGERESDIGGETLEEVLHAAGSRYGDVFSDVLRRSRVWVNGQPASPDDKVAATDEVAVLPPVSGG
ncbi:MAG: MoaD/ThiS family protein, partial [Acidimicrobiales bacterium]